MGEHDKLRHVSDKEIAALLVAQDYSCAICRRAFGEEKPAFVGGTWRREAQVDVDHSHHTGRVRGLLCTRCNRNLGWLETHLAVIRVYVWGET